MKRLLYIGNKLSAQGSVTYIEKLGNLLEKEGHTLHYASSKLNKFVRMLDMVRTTIVQSTKTDCVLIDTYSTSNFWYAVAISQLCRLFRLKYIPILHGGNLPNRLKQNPLLSQLVFKYAYANVAPSGYLLEAFQKAGFVNTIFIPNTLQLPDYRFQPRTKLRPRLFWLRSFTAIYNPQMALDVLEQVQQKYPDAQLCMAGPDKGNLESVRKLAQGRNLKVTFPGKLTLSEWTVLSSTYDIFINTTHFDNTPLSVMEAMALGLPVVSTNVGGIPFLLRDNETALLVDDNDADAMAQCIDRLITDPMLAAKLVQNAKNKVAEFDWKDVKEKWAEILK